MPLLFQLPPAAPSTPPLPAAPSIMGSRSRCTPSALASPPYRCSVDVTILSISSMNTMPAVLGRWGGRVVKGQAQAIKAGDAACEPSRELQWLRAAVAEC